MDINKVSSEIVLAAIRVHQELGPGLLESVYQKCLSIELNKRSVKHETEVPVPIKYRGQELSGEGFRLDLLVADRVIVELKSVERLQPIHFKQTLTYLRLADKPLGLLINFNVNLLKDGIQRIANNL